jgi:hypothetical protein
MSNEQQLNDMERIQRLEAYMAEQAAYNDGIRASLDGIFAKLNNLALPEAPRMTESPIVPPEIITESSNHVHPAKDSKLKPSPLMDYDGDRAKGQTFLNQCELYFSLRPSDFDNDLIRINWTLSFMKSGRAAAFADRLITHQTKKGVP